MTQGPADIAAAALVVRQLQAEQASREAEGTQFKESELTNARRRSEELQERVRPCEQELTRREGS